jgi:hypothetical protein
MYIYKFSFFFLLRITDGMTSQNIDLSFWNIQYIEYLTDLDRTENTSPIVARVFIAAGTC